MRMQPAAEHPYAGVLGLPDHRVRSVGHVGQLLLGEGHRAIIERDQIPRHLITPLSAACSDRISLLRTDPRAVETDKPPMTHRLRQDPASRLQVPIASAGPVPVARKTRRAVA